MSSSSGGLQRLEESAESAFDYALPGVSDPATDERQGKPSLAAIRHIGTRTFYHSENVWYESEFDPTTSKIARTVSVGSDEYIKLLLDDERLAKFFALGDVVLQIGDEWLRIEG